MADGVPEMNKPPRKKYVRAVGPRLRILLLCIFGLVAVLAANSIYLSAITCLEWLKGDPNVTYQNWFYMVMFGPHLGLGLLLVLPFVVFGIVHMANSYNRPNRRAVKAGYMLFATSLIVLITGLLLTRIDVFQFKNLGLKDPRLRSVAYWAHIITPLLAIWLYILHRLAGPRINWRVRVRLGGGGGGPPAGIGRFRFSPPHKKPNRAGGGGKNFLTPPAPPAHRQILSP